ncbi:hypothetical protein TNCV_2519701 [Trichonephila clavipes]|nr:hypothetical protein TNCV_2519701 [Trichonephila clavipes]
MMRVLSTHEPTAATAARILSPHPHPLRIRNIVSPPPPEEDAASVASRGRRVPRSRTCQCRVTGTDEGMRNDVS